MVYLLRRVAEHQVRIMHIISEWKLALLGTSRNWSRKKLIRCSVRVKVNCVSPYMVVIAKNPVEIIMMPAARTLLSVVGHRHQGPQRTSSAVNHPFRWRRPLRMKTRTMHQGRAR